MALWGVPLKWNIDQKILDEWISEVGQALAYAIVASAPVPFGPECLSERHLTRTLH